MQKTAVFDIEATNWINFACLGFFDGQDYRVFWGIEDFLDHFLTKKYRGYNCFAHFGGKYDFRFLIPSLIDSGRFTLKFLERNSKILSIRVIDNKNRYSWKFSDSFFLLPHSLKELGKNFQIKYMKLDFDVEAEKDFKSEKAQEYLKNDCLGLYEILEKFSKWGLNNGTLKATLPSQSLYIFKENFLRYRLQSVSESQESFLRNTYFGGRVEIFRMRGKGLYYYDFNSLYPKVMLEEMPIGRPLTVSTYYPRNIGFYEIEADIPSNILIPPLPVVRQNKLFFPVGKGDFFTTSAEIQILIDLKIPFKVKQGIVFEKKAPIFKEYIEKMFEIRMNTPRGTMENLLAKLMMNSLYGKFGQKRDNTEMIFSDHPEKGWIPYDEKFGLYLQEKRSRSRFILPYLASYITSLARATLYRKMLSCGFENIWYCDTDSIITSKEIKCGEGLGELKLEYRIKEAVFLQPKAYCLKLEDNTEIIRIKGMKDVKIGLKEFIIAFKSGEMSNIHTKYFNIMGFRECIRRDKSLKINRKEVYKKLNSIYDKRIIENDLTRPYSYENI